MLSMFHLRNLFHIASLADSGAVCDFEGQEFKWNSNCYLRLDPFQNKIPIYISGFSKDLLKLSGEIGDGSLPMLTLPESIRV
jgi:hypothetical protein